MELFQNNYTKTWNEIKKGLIKWSKYNLSFMGRIAAIKMNILPQMLYLFSNIPIIGNDKCFDIWQKDLSRFLWQGKKARIKWKLLTEEKIKGGDVIYQRFTITRHALIG